MGHLFWSIVFLHAVVVVDAARRGEFVFPALCGFMGSIITWELLRPCCYAPGQGMIGLMLAFASVPVLLGYPLYRLGRWMWTNRKPTSGPR
jgi:hypothetical protein